MPKISLLQWQKRYGTEKACASTLTKYRWPNGFICPKCGHDSSYYIASRKVYQCCRCRNQVSVTAGTLFHSTNLPLVKWFWAIYLMASDKGGISALRLSKHIDVSWSTTRNMLKKIRTAMAIAVDSVETVEKLLESNIEEMLEAISTLNNECVVGIGKRNKDDELVQILDLGELIEKEELSAYDIN